jgi:hypothetical protein
MGATCNNAAAAEHSMCRSPEPQREAAFAPPMSSSLGEYPQSPRSGSINADEVMEQLQAGEGTSDRSRREGTRLASPGEASPSRRPDVHYGS